MHAQTAPPQPEPPTSYIYIYICTEVNTGRKHDIHTTTNTTKDPILFCSQAYQGESLLVENIHVGILWIPSVVGLSSNWIHWSPRCWHSGVQTQEPAAPIQLLVLGPPLTRTMDPYSNWSWTLGLSSCALLHPLVS